MNGLNAQMGGLLGLLGGSTSQGLGGQQQTAFQNAQMGGLQQQLAQQNPLIAFRHRQEPPKRKKVESEVIDEEPYFPRSKHLLYGGI